CGSGELRDSTFCEVEMLTTASITFSATSAMVSGPRAADEVDSAGRAIAVAASTAKAGWRGCRGNWKNVASIDVRAPRGVICGTVRPSVPGRKGDLAAAN